MKSLVRIFTRKRIIAFLGITVFLWLLWVFLPILTYDKTEYYTNNSVITDRHNQIFYTFPKPHYTYQQNISLEEVPELFLKLLVWKEDQTFYENHGIALWTKIKLLGEFIITGEYRRGGSTITEQWIKNKYFLGKKRNGLQKLREMNAAFVLGMLTPKEQILEEYMNHIYFGNLAYGIEAAASFHFQKLASELNPTEQILLLSLISNPARLYNDNFGFTEQKRFYLDLALKKAWLPELAYREYSQYRINLNFPETRRTENIFFIEELLKQIPSEFQLEQGGFLIKATLDKQLQTEIWEEVQDILPDLQTKNAHDIGVVLLNGKTGEVHALIGSSDPNNKKTGQINTAMQPRPIASTIKPFLFFTGLLFGIRPENIILDVEQNYPIENGEMYRVKNYNGLEYGLVTVEQSLANSLNIGSVKLLHHIRIETFWELCEQIGFTFLKDTNFYGLSLAIGTSEHTLLDLVSYYSLFQNEGNKVVSPQFLQSIVEDSSGEVLFTQTRNIKDVDLGNLEKQKWAAQEIVRILSDENLRQKSFGFNSLFNDGRNIAYKTGTSSDFHDNWAIGFDDMFVIGAWVGNLSNEKMDILSGVQGSGPILKRMVQLKDMRGGRPKPFSELNTCRENFLISEDIDVYTSLHPEEIILSCNEK
jgi:membrane carboxypeptidase/penicillin-binding protein PbpC